ncbi:Predicted hydrolase of the alpha/beta superfamily [Winogradskyella sediminis]|uniref:Predicted hydrolase of the alpha/beta superfamily n=2 Tax=Winogradskyella sediminis TaxID=1382466 RepID=A0A1H1NQU8_9FLAO|nr:Predicted hydrolase of the alpha/beta superfamily [Winogradskyella sediminis]
MKMKHLHLLFIVLISYYSTAQSTASEQVTTFIITAPQLKTEKTIWVYLPTNYKNSEKSFPVIYMHDAQNLFDVETSYVGEWKVDEYMDTLTQNESIIIGIAHGNEKRLDELTPYKHKKYGGGYGDAYLTFVQNTLKPYIDVTYRTKPEAEYTTIFGSSLGGLMSFYAVIKYPGTFGKAGVFSPAFWINPEIFELVKTTNIPMTSKFYFLAGTAEGETMVPKLEAMTTLLKSKGVQTNQFKSQIIKGGQHNETFWSAHFGDAYQYLIIQN